MEKQRSNIAVRQDRSHRRSDDMGQYLEPILIATILYPLKRIQANFQIQQSFAKEEIKQCKQFFTRNTHYGIRSLFRGLTPYFLKMSLPYSVYHFAESSFATKLSVDSEWGKGWVPEIAKGAALSFAYFVIYPFENVKLRMGADVQNSRVYKNIRDCLSKMNKIEGKSSYYRGFRLSLPYILLQYYSAIILYKFLIQNQKNQKFPSILKSQTGLFLFFISYLSCQIALYPLDSIRKHLQINGALNHHNLGARYRDILKLNNFGSFYKGLGYKLSFGLTYSAIILGIQKSRQFY